MAPTNVSSADENFIKVMLTVAHDVQGVILCHAVLPYQNYQCTI